MAFFDHVLRLRADGWYFESLASDQRDALLQARCEEFEALLDAAAPAARSRLAGRPFGGAIADRHLAAVEQAIESIRAGDIYQANVCTRLGGAFAGSGTELFAAAVRELAPDYAAYVEADGRRVASLSPELFLRRRGRDVLSAPIKGTAPLDRGRPSGCGASAKDAAENVMIVDLMRNDLGSVCRDRQRGGA